MNALPITFLDAMDSAFTTIRDQIELNEVMVEGELSIIREGKHPDAVSTPVGDEGADDLINALRDHAAVEWQEIHSTIEMALVRGRAEGAAWAMSAIASGISDWVSQAEFNEDHEHL
jgi:hypothetical protein